MTPNFRALTERDYPDCVAINCAVYPERSDTAAAWREAAEDLRSGRTPGGRHVATVGSADQVVAFGIITLPRHLAAPGKCRIELVVSPDWQRRGIGGSFLRFLEAELRAFPFTVARVSVRRDHGASLEFASRHGYIECLRSLEMVLNLEEVHLSSGEAVPLPGDVVITTLAAERQVRPDPVQELHALDCAIAADEPRIDPYTPQSLEDFLHWLESPNAIPEGFFLAKHGSEYVGLSVLRRLPGRPDQLQQSITGVVRGYRRRGLARALKLATLRYAREHACKRIKTGMAASNLAMVRLNEELGFVAASGWVILEKPLARS